MNLILIKQSRDSTHVNRHKTELFETYILTPLFETKTILSLFNNHYYMAKATFGRITQCAWTIRGPCFGVMPAGD